MKKLVILISLFLICALAACGQSEEPTQIVSDVQITLNVEPDPPNAGETTLIITLTESDETPIDGASIHVHGDMDHEGMVPVDGEADASVDGVYRVPFEWTMGGGWIVDVTATLPDDRGVATETFELFVEAVSSDSIIRQTPNQDSESDDSGQPSSDREYQIIIPEGTAALIATGQEPNVIPQEINLILGEQDILIIQNNDVEDHSVGPFFVRSGETIRQVFTRPAVYMDVCTIHLDTQVRITVTEADTLPSFADQIRGAIMNPPRIVEDFSMASTTGDPFTLSEHQGEIVLLYFGYLSCPDVCPTTLAQLRWAFEILGELTEQVKVVFVTVDPERDTLDRMAQFTSRFNDEFISVRDESEALQDLIDQFGVVATRREVDSPLVYMIDHTASVFLIDPEGRLLIQFVYGTTAQDMAHDIEIILTSGDEN